jgi:hypothetical protein
MFLLHYKPTVLAAPLVEDHIAAAVGDAPDEELDNTKDHDTPCYFAVNDAGAFAANFDSDHSEADDLVSAVIANDEANTVMPVGVRSCPTTQEAKDLLSGIK